LAEGGREAHGHYGLRGLRERFEGLGGVFEVGDRRPLPGTRIRGRITTY
jgi:signal transduction histidine kinase